MMRFALALVAAVALLPGCTALYDFDSQCSSDSDCGGDRCIDNACVAGPLPCASHLDCDQTAELTGTELCIAEACTAVLFETEEGGGCDAIYGELADNPRDNIIVPQVISVTGDSILYGNVGATNGARMAVQFANDSGALGQRRALLIACDDTSDPAVSSAISRRILDATGATSFLGPSGDASQGALVDVILPKDVLTFAATTGVTYANLVDDDLAFRTYPSDQLVVDGLAAIRHRFSPGVRIGMLYRRDAPIRKVLAESVLQELADTEVLVAAYDGADPADIARAGAELATAGGGEPVDILFLIGIGETSAALTAYRDALTSGFDGAPPSVFVDAGAALNIPRLVEVDPNLSPFTVNAVVGAAVVVDRFERLYQTTLGTTDDIQLASLFYDAAMLTLLTHVAVPDATTGRQLSTALRSLIASGEGPVVDGSDGVRAFSEAGARLATGRPVQYVLTSGGIPVRFDERGDIPFPVISGTFLDDPPTFFIPTRLFDQGLWLDACFEFGAACEGPWIAGTEGLGQRCMDIGQGELGACFPQCAEESACPIEGFTCTPMDAASVCLPPATGQ